MGSIEYQNQLIEGFEKLRDFNINCVEDKKLAEYYQGWIDEFKSGKIKNEKMIRYIENQIDYWQPKDRLYVKYLQSLIKESI
jgi:hypothetical protein